MLEERVEQRTKELVAPRMTAEAANHAKSDFLANMSHELRTPLNSVIGFAEVIGKGMAGPVTSEQKEFLGDIEGSGRHLLELINDILDLSKIEAGKTELERSRFQLRELLENSLSMFREKAMRHGSELHTELPADLGGYEGDKRRLRQVLFNLLGNALKFTPDHGRVGIRAVREPATIRITVWDTCIGIAAKEQHKLFQPFQQLEQSLTKQSPGTGLGLPLSRKIIEMHGGEIHVESSSGKGSAFTFSLPLTHKGAR